MTVALQRCLRKRTERETISKQKTLNHAQYGKPAHHVSWMVTSVSHLMSPVDMSEPGSHASGQWMRYMSRYLTPRSPRVFWQEARRAAGRCASLQTLEQMNSSERRPSAMKSRRPSPMSHSLSVAAQSKWR